MCMKTDTTIKKVTEVKPKKKAPKKNKNFLNNKDMLNQWKMSSKADDMTPIFSNMILILTKRYSSAVRFNVCDTFRDDMESYALMTVSKVWRSFDPEKSNNPFAYFTQVIKRAFYQYQNLERRQRDIGNALTIDVGNSPSHAYMVEYEFRDYDPQKAGGDVTITYGDDYNKEKHDEELEVFANQPVYGRKPKPKPKKPDPIISEGSVEALLGKLDGS